MDARFVYRNDGRLFRKQRVSTAPHRLDAEAGPHPGRPDSIVAQPWGPWRWPLMLSAPERAVLELLDELPDKESFHQADMLMEGLSTLSPAGCRRCSPTAAASRSSACSSSSPTATTTPGSSAWTGRPSILGSGKRMLVKGGKLDAKHLITVPETFDGVQ